MPTEVTKKKFRALLTEALDKVGDALEFLDANVKEFEENADDVYFEQLLLDAEDALESVENDVKGG